MWLLGIPGGRHLGALLAASRTSFSEMLCSDMPGAIELPEDAEGEAKGAGAATAGEEGERLGVVGDDEERRCEVIPGGGGDWSESEGAQGDRGLRAKLGWRIKYSGECECVLGYIKRVCLCVYIYTHTRFHVGKASSICKHCLPNSMRVLCVRRWEKGCGGK